MDQHTATASPEASPTPIPTPAPPPHDKDDDVPATKLTIKRIAKIAAIILLYFTVQGLVNGVHSAFSTLTNMDFLGLSAFWQTIVRYTANGAADGFLEAIRLLLIAWAGPDVINVVGPIIGSAWRKAAVAVRQMSRAVQGKNDDDTPVDPSKK